MDPSEYLVMKDILIRESVKEGLFKKDELGTTLNIGIFFQKFIFLKFKR